MYYLQKTVLIRPFKNGKETAEIVITEKYFDAGFCILLKHIKCIVSCNRVSIYRYRQDDKTVKNVAKLNSGD